MANRTLPSAFVKSVLQNGVGRYVCQLQRLTIKFCKSHGSSRGVRDFIENDLVDFARNNPGVVVYLKPRRHRAPILDAEYLNGEKDYQSCCNYSREEMVKYIEYLKNKSGFPIARLRKFWHTDNPSIQGIWSPFTNMDPKMNVRTFPDSEAFRVNVKHLSATEILLQTSKNCSDSQAKAGEDKKVE